MVLPPSFAGAVKATDPVSPATLKVPIVGAPGTVAGVTLFDAFDGSPVPTALVAVTVHAYALPFVSPVTTIGLAPPELVPVTPPFVEVHVAA